MTKPKTTKAQPAKRGAKPPGRAPQLIKDETLQPRIQAALERGLTHAMACAECGISRETFYQYVKLYSDFSDMVTRAEAVALTKAVKAFASGLEAQKTNHAEITTFTETRIGKDGKPYQYTKETRATKLIETAPDWRAGQAWLERRDRENWGQRIDVVLGVEITVLKRLKEKAAAAGVDLTSVFEEMVNELGSIAVTNSSPQSGEGGVSNE